MSVNRRTILAASAATAVAGLVDRKAVAAPLKAFPKDFLWGAATAGHQIEGNNTASDIWFVEHVKPTMFAEPSGDACNSFALWPVDLDIVRDLGLGAYRFSLEWARIEPARGEFSEAMLDHYKAVIAGCHARGLVPVVTFNHNSAPLWFAALGGWTNPDSSALFGRFCDRAAKSLADGMGYAATINEPNVVDLLGGGGLPPEFNLGVKAMNSAASKALGVPNFAALVPPDVSDLDALQRNLIAGHRAAKAAIKAARSDLPVGVTLSIQDFQSSGPGSVRDVHRARAYDTWLQVAKEDDFLGVQNYERFVFDSKGMMPPPKGAELNFDGREIYAPSLAGAVRYAHAATGVPIIVTEHGLNTQNDAQRAAFIPAALIELQKAIADGVPVKGYLHWSLLDNFEWFSGYKPRYGLVAVDRTTFRRTPKPSAAVLGAIAKRNAV